MMEEDYFLQDMTLVNEIQEIEEADNLLSLRRLKIYKTRENLFEKLDEEEFRTKYRFSKTTALYVIDIVKGNLEHDLRGGAVAPYLQVLTAIRTWARGELKITLVTTLLTLVVVVVYLSAYCSPNNVSKPYLCLIFRYKMMQEICQALVNHRFNGRATEHSYSRILCHMWLQTGFRCNRLYPY